MQSSLPLFSWGEEEGGQGIKRLAQAYARYHIKERERGEPLLPRAHAPIRLHGSHTMMATCISTSRCVGRDNVLTKAVGWKFANSGAHALLYSSTASWVLAVLQLLDIYV